MSENISNHNQFKEAVQAAIKAAALDGELVDDFVGGQYHLTRDDMGKLLITTDDVRVETEAMLNVPDPEPPVEPEPDPEPPVEPDPEPAPPVVPGARVTIYISNDGDNTSHGMSESHAVKTIARAKHIAYEARNSDTPAPLTFAFRRGDTFPEFDLMIAYNTQGKGKLVGGFDADNLTLFTAYGEGPKPLFDIGGKTGFRAVSNAGDADRMSFCHFKSLQFIGTGTAIGCLGKADTIIIEDCDMNGTSVVIQKWSSGRVSNLKIIDTVIKNCGNGSSGAFLNGIDGVLFDRSVFYRNGYKSPMGQTVRDTPDIDLTISTREHGVYIVNDCTGCRIENSFAVFNSGAGWQMRGGGDLFDSVVYGNRRTGVDWGLVNGSPTGIGGKTGEVSRNYVKDDGAAWGFGASNIASGHVHNNTFVWGGVGWRTPLYLRSDWGPNNHSKEVPGGERVGLNNLLVEDNNVYGHINAQYNGWGKMGGDGVTLRNNKATGELTKSDFDDPDGKLVVDGDGQFGVDLPAINHPDLSSETINRILNREVRAVDFIQEILTTA